MDTSTPNHIYQVPPSPSDDSFEMSEPEVDQRFEAIARESVDEAFFDQVSPEFIPNYSTEGHMLRTGDDITERRMRYFTSIIENNHPVRRLGQLVTAGFTVKSNSPVHPVLTKIVDSEAKLVGAPIYPTNDPDIISRQFFFLPGEDAEAKKELHMWHFAQVSKVPEKHFTITFKVSESGTTKSSTYHDPELRQVINTSSIPSELEIHNLFIATKKYHAGVIEKVYEKKPRSWLKFALKGKDDLAA